MQNEQEEKRLREQFLFDGDEEPDTDLMDPYQV